MAVSAAALENMIGAELGVSDWTLISQDMINRFADLTGDRNFIHVDPEAAAQTPFGGAIAHGFLVLSLLAKFQYGVNIQIDGASIGLNYGFDRVRFVAPVRAGKRIRGRFILSDVQERSPGRWLLTVSASVEIEDEDKPAAVADWLILQIAG